MTAPTWSRRGFFLLPGAAVVASAAVYGAKQVARVSRTRQPGDDNGFAPFVDQDGWMLAPTDRLRTAGRPEGTGP